MKRPTDHQMMYSSPKKLLMRLHQNPQKLACPQVTAEWSLMVVLTEATVPKVLNEDLKHKYSQLSAECVTLRLEVEN
ncbi:hypothetical protein QQF64_018598 [Cirrhinus molitorella]|uniref:Uncharacterized protein n=1 Tax=Cirrhinus molitorella TaxID=172907 RepID=A0ABR3LD39_9TELE